MGIKITIPCRVHPSLNEWKNWHWTKVGREKVSWEKEIYYELKLAKAPLFKFPKVKITYYFKDKRARDKDNYAPKFILDGIKKAKVIIDDSVLKSICDWELLIGTGETKTVIEIEEKENK